MQSWIGVGARRFAVGAIGATAMLVGAMAAMGAAQSPGRALRLYVLDGGVLESDPGRYRLTPQEVAATELSVAAYLVTHPKGTLLWDTGAIADDSWTPNGKPQRRHLVLSNGQDRYVTVRSSLRAQLRAAGVTAKDVTYLALSHYHWDHVANANDYAAATWLVRRAERDGLLSQLALTPPVPSTVAALQKAKATFITTDEHDVFGDGTVVIKSSPGHTPGHQVLSLRLPKTGGIVLSGDLYHYPEERSLNRLPVADFDEAQTVASRAALDTFLKQSGAALWIQHDLLAHRKLKKAPAFYD